MCVMILASLAPRLKEIFASNLTSKGNRPICLNGGGHILPPTAFAGANQTGQRTNLVMTRSRTARRRLATNNFWRFRYV